MDTTLVVIIALFAVIVVGALLVFRRRANVEIKSPARRLPAWATSA